MMGVERTFQGRTAIYKLSGIFDIELAHQYIDLNFSDYNEIGDALGAIVDFQEVEQIRLSGLRAAQGRLRGLVFHNPVAFVGQPSSVLFTFLQGLDALSSRGKSRFRFFSTVEEGLVWIDQWYQFNQFDREQLYKKISTKVTIRSL